MTDKTDEISENIENNNTDNIIFLEEKSKTLVKVNDNREKI